MLSGAGASWLCPHRLAWDSSLDIAEVTSFSEGTQSSLPCLPRKVTVMTLRCHVYVSKQVHVPNEVYKVSE